MRISRRPSQRFDDRSVILGAIRNAPPSQTLLGVARTQRDDYSYDPTTSAPAPPLAGAVPLGLVTLTAWPGAAASVSGRFSSGRRCRVARTAIERP
jgi:hypothetical protein